MQHKPMTHLRILSDDSVIRVPEGSIALQHDCGEEIPITWPFTEPEAEVVCERCAKERGYQW